MKKILFLLLILIIPICYSSTYLDYLTCSGLSIGMCPNAIFETANITNLNAINTTVTNYNVTGNFTGDVLYVNEIYVGTDSDYLHFYEDTINSSTGIIMFDDDVVQLFAPTTQIYVDEVITRGGSVEAQTDLGHYYLSTTDGFDIALINASRTTLLDSELNFFLLDDDGSGWSNPLRLYANGNISMPDGGDFSTAGSYCDSTGCYNLTTLNESASIWTEQPVGTAFYDGDVNATDITAEKLIIHSAGNEDFSTYHEGGYPGFFGSYGDMFFGVSGDETTYFNYYNGDYMWLGYGGNLQEVTVFGTINVSNNVGRDFEISHDLFDSTILTNGQGTITISESGTIYINQIGGNNLYVGSLTNLQTTNFYGTIETSGGATFGNTVRGLGDITADGTLSSAGGDIYAVVGNIYTTLGNITSGDDLFVGDDATIGGTIGNTTHRYTWEELNASTPAPDLSIYLTNHTDINQTNVYIEDMMVVGTGTDKLKINSTGLHFGWT